MSYDNTPAERLEAATEQADGGTVAAASTPTVQNHAPAPDTTDSTGSTAPENLTSEAAAMPATDARPSDKVQDTFPDAPFVPGSVTDDDVREVLKDVIDPELMINIVDLGLVYDVRIDEEGICIIDMTLTSPTCPMTDRIEYDAQIALQGIVKAAIINWVWIPAWNLSMITDDGREQLRAVGFAI